MKPRAAEAWELSAVVELLSLVTLHLQGCWWLLHSPKNCPAVWTCPLLSRISHFSSSTQHHWRAHILICCSGKDWGAQGEEPWTKTGPPPLLTHHTLITNKGSKIFWNNNQGSSQGSSSKLVPVEILSGLLVRDVGLQSKQQQQLESANKLLLSQRQPPQLQWQEYSMAIPLSSSLAAMTSDLDHFLLQRCSQETRHWEATYLSATMIPCRKILSVNSLVCAQHVPLGFLASCYFITFGNEDFKS